MNMLEEAGSDVDPYSPSLHVTLDLICLTLPQEIEPTRAWKSSEGIIGSHTTTSEVNEDILVDSLQSPDPEGVAQEFFALRKQDQARTLTEKERYFL